MWAYDLFSGYSNLLLPHFFVYRSFGCILDEDLLDPPQNISVRVSSPTQAQLTWSIASSSKYRLLVFVLAFLLYLSFILREIANEDGNIGEMIPTTHPCLEQYVAIESLVDRAWGF